MNAKPHSGRPFKIGLVVNEFFCDEYPPLGGFGLTAKNFAEFFNGQGRYNVEVVALLPPYPGHGEAPQELHGTRIIAPREKLTWRNYSAFRRYRDALAREDFDLLISIEHYPNYFGRLAALPRTPWLHWIRDPKSEKNWTRILDLRHSDFPCEYSEKSTSQYRSYRELQILRRLMGRKFHCGIQELWLVDRTRAGYPLIGDDFSRLVNRIQVPEGDLEKSPRPMVLFIGRLVAVKRPWIYFELARRFPKVDFCVVGEMDRKQHQEQLVRDACRTPNLRFLGKKVGRDLDLVLEKAWVLVNTSLHEGMPQSILQGLAFEVPVVSALDFGGSIGRYGVFVGEGKGDGLDEVDSFAQGLGELLRNEGLRKELGRAGRSFVRANYTDGAFLDQFLAIMEKMGLSIKEKITKTDLNPTTVCQ
jgi:glycosyltransferase involved in cell wall biosynthesis